jgi:hypothetical protein
MKNSVQEEIVRNLRNVYNYINQPLPPSFINYARQNCNDDFEKLAGNPRFQKYVDELKSFSSRYLEFKRIYHRLLIDIYRNSSKQKES